MPRRVLTEKLQAELGGTVDFSFGHGQARLVFGSEPTKERGEGAEVVAEAHDDGQLAPRLAEVVETFGRAADLSVADASYDDGASFADVAMRQIPVAVPLTSPPQQGPYAKDKFRYDAERDGYVVCGRRPQSIRACAPLRSVSAAAR